jgi:shikimate kinase
MMGSGKTTVGRALARRTGTEFLDTDWLVVSDAGQSVAQIFTSEGEVGFRARESVAVARASTNPRAVVATGGGVVLAAENIDVMRASGPVIWLRADASTLVDRTRGAGDRPLLDGGDALSRLQELARDRESAYEAAADHVVVTDRLAIDGVVELVEALWNAS